MLKDDQPAAGEELNSELVNLYPRATAPMSLSHRHAIEILEAGEPIHGLIEFLRK